MDFSPMDLSATGLILIAGAWVIQFIYCSFSKKKKELNPMFVLVYLAGMIPLTVDVFMKGSGTAWYQLICFIAALLVFGSLMLRKKH
jgi:hypothetical protein